MSAIEVVGFRHCASLPILSLPTVWEFNSQVWCLLLSFQVEPHVPKSTSLWLESPILQATTTCAGVHHLPDIGSDVAS